MLVLTTPRLRLRGWSLDDAGRAHGLWSDPEVMAQVIGGPHREREDTRRRLEDVTARCAAGRCLAWAVEHGDELCGSVMLVPFDDGPALELSYQVGRAWWGRGFATEAARAAVDHAFETTPAPRIVAGTLGDHPASAKVLLKLGFVPKGTIVWPDNHQEDPYFELERRG